MTLWQTCGFLNLRPVFPTPSHAGPKIWVMDTPRDVRCRVKITKRRSAPPGTRDSSWPKNLQSEILSTKGPSTRVRIAVRFRARFAAKGLRVLILYHTPITTV
jgi:hypothetical protein